MEWAWEALREVGLPEGAIRPAAGAAPDASLRAAVDAAVLDTTVEPARREPLLAWLLAFRRHWPAAFVAILGEAGERAVDALTAQPHDENRVLKLRRIAIENLATRL